MNVMIKTENKEKVIEYITNILIEKCKVKKRLQIKMKRVELFASLT